MTVSHPVKQFFRSCCFEPLIICLILLWSFITAAAQANQTNVRFTEANVNDSAQLSFSVPFMSYKGRGVDLPVGLTYSSDVWNIEHYGTVHVLGAIRQSVTEAVYAKHSIAGWRSTLDLPVIEFPKSSVVYDYLGRASSGSSGGQCAPFRIAEVYIHMPDGSTHTLRKSDQPYNSPSSVDMTGTFYAIDGSRMKFVANGTANTGTIYMPDGSYYTIGTSTSTLTDRNDPAVDRHLEPADHQSTAHKPDRGNDNNGEPAWTQRREPGRLSDISTQMGIPGRYAYTRRV
jgi:hypothetical protein